MGETMTFPETVEEFMEQYKIVDREQVYTNGAELVPIFRMKQWFEHEKAQLSSEGTTSDLISRQAALDALAKIAREKFNLSDEYNHYLAGLMDGELAIKGLPTVQPEPAIPLSWIENEIKWLKSLDNTFSEITALQISAMVKKWRDEKK